MSVALSQFQRLDVVALKDDLPDHPLVAGQVGTLSRRGRGIGAPRPSAAGEIRSMIEPPVLRIGAGFD